MYGRHCYLCLIEAEFLFQDFRGFENLNVLVVGIGNSATDVGCELSRHAKHVRNFKGFKVVKKNKKNIIVKVMQNHLSEIVFHFRSIKVIEFC